MLRCQQDDKPYRIIVSIIRGTNAGRALELMRSGMQCASETYEGALKILDDYYDAACAVLDSVSEGICFGMTAILDTRTGKVEHTGSLMGRSQETTLGRSKVG
jgi:hypothetical protein